MAFWQGFWSVVWFAGLGLFAVLAVVITVQGGRDLRVLLRELREEGER
jgi:hypothetical protein